VAAMAGPMPADEVLRLVEAEVGISTQLPGGASGPTRMLCLQGRFADARAALARVTDVVAEHGGQILTSSEAHEVSGNVALMAGELSEAVHDLQLAYDEKMAAGDRAGAYSTATGLAEAYLGVQDLDRAQQYAEIARDTSSGDDFASQGRSRQVLARILSVRGQHAEAEALAREAVAIVGTTDYLVVHGDALAHLAHVLHAAGKGDEAVGSARQAVELYERKGATFPADRTRDLIRTWSSKTGERASS
jgi:tetratricopeptide (TPR) repeat protein